MLYGLDIEAAAKEFAGNHKNFESFGWHSCPENSERYGIWYGNNRDADVLTRSNWDVIQRELSKFNQSIHIENHGHWACGWVEGLVIKVYNSKGKITKGFEAFYEIMRGLEDYPVLDEEDLSEKEMEEQDKAWENDIAHDFECALEDIMFKDLNEKEFYLNMEDVERNDLYGIFCKAADEANEYWEDGWISVDNVIKGATFNAEELIKIGAKPIDEEHKETMVDFWRDTATTPLF